MGNLGIKISEAQVRDALIEELIKADLQNAPELARIQAANFTLDVVMFFENVQARYQYAAALNISIREFQDLIITGLGCRLHGYEPCLNSCQWILDHIPEESLGAETVEYFRTRCNLILQEVGASLAQSGTADQLVPAGYPKF